MTLGLRDIALFVLFALGGLGVWRYFYLENKVSEQKNQIEGLSTALDAANKRMTEFDVALAGKLDADEYDRTRLASVSRKLEQIKNEDQTVRAWADMPIPVSVRNLDATESSDPAGSVDTALQDGRPDN